MMLVQFDVLSVWFVAVSESERGTRNNSVVSKIKVHQLKRVVGVMVLRVCVPRGVHSQCKIVRPS
jgi:hypothetical protein